MIELYKQFKKYGKVRLNEPLSKHTTFKIGGPASFFVIVDSVENLIAVLKLIAENGLDFFMLGGGSNVLAPDDGYDGVVIKMTGKEIKIEGESLVADAGCPTAEVAQQSIANKLTGFEWGVAVPGTIGGAVRGNAGAMGAEMKESVEKVEVFQNGEVLEFSNSDCYFGYRDSVFKHDSGIVLRVHLKLKKGEDKDLAAEALKNIGYRQETQPKGFSSGCIFKNVSVEKFKEVPTEFVGKKFVSAGWLIDKTGLKGKQIGDIKISEKHGNFILNLGNGSARDVKEMIEEVKAAVYKKFHINLEEEIHII